MFVRRSRCSYIEQFASTSNLFINALRQARSIRAVAQGHSCMAWPLRMCARCGNAWRCALPINWRHLMTEAFLCDAIRTPIGRYAGALSSVRADDLGAVPLKALMERNKDVDWSAIDDVIYGCANQAGEDNRNVARMALLLAGLPQTVPGSTVNRLCGSGMDAVAIAGRAIQSAEAQLVIAGGVESMSRAPLVLAKADTAFSRTQKLEDTTLGWRFINPLLRERYGVDSMA